MPVRNRAISLLLMPMAAFLFCIGISLMWLGTKKDLSMPQPKLSREKDLTFVMPVLEQEETTYKVTEQLDHQLFNTFD